MQRKKLGCVVYALLLLSVSSMMDGSARGQTTSLPSVEKALDQVVQPPAGNDLQMEQFLLARIPPLPKPSSAKPWSDDEKRLRQRILRDVVYFGWPQEWVDSAPHFELMGTIETDKGTRFGNSAIRLFPVSWVRPCSTNPRIFTSECLQFLICRPRTCRHRGGV
jgi:hypothetical protein